MIKKFSESFKLQAVEKLLNKDDGSYQTCRKKFVSKLSRWEKFRGAMHFFIMGAWEMMMDFLLNEDDYEVPLTKKV